MKNLFLLIFIFFNVSLCSLSAQFWSFEESCPAPNYAFNEQGSCVGEWGAASGTPWHLHVSPTLDPSAYHGEKFVWMYALYNSISQQHNSEGLFLNKDFVSETNYNISFAGRVIKSNMDKIEIILVQDELVPALYWPAWPNDITPDIPENSKIIHTMSLPQSDDYSNIQIPEFYLDADESYNQLWIRLTKYSLESNSVLLLDAFQIEEEDISCDYNPDFKVSTCTPDINQPTQIVATPHDEEGQHRWELFYGDTPNGPWQSTQFISTSTIYENTIEQCGFYRLTHYYNIPGCPETSCTRSYVGYNCMYECRTLGFQDDGFSERESNIEDTEVEEIQKFEVLQVSPNPVNDMLTIDYDTEKDLSLTIRNSNGQTLINQQLSNERASVKIDVKNFVSGLYFITMMDENGNIETKKVVVTK